MTGTIEMPHRIGRTDDDLRRRLDSYIVACRALPPRGEGRLIGDLSAMVLARLDLRLALDRLADECGVEKL